MFRMVCATQHSPRPAVDSHSSLIRQGKFEEMAALITDEMLDDYAVVCRWDELADRLIQRYSGTASRLVMYLAEESIRHDPSAVDRWGEVARAVRAAE